MFTFSIAGMVNTIIVVFIVFAALINEFCLFKVKQIILFWSTAVKLKQASVIVVTFDLTFLEF
jgi:hypothetical protein